jgi:hypothetical protein
MSGLTTLLSKLISAAKATTRAKVTATTPDAGNSDSSLPDPTAAARSTLFGLVVLALVASVVMNPLKWTGKPFSPSATAMANFALFASFYVAAQVIERLMQLIAPLVPLWTPYLPHGQRRSQGSAREGRTRDGRARHRVTDRRRCELRLRTVLPRHGRHTHIAHYRRILDRITIAAGTKPRHDLIGLIQNQNTPTTGTGAK